MTDMKNKKWILNNNITRNGYPLSGAYREEPYNDEDSGWRLISAGDTEVFINNPVNSFAATLAEVLTIEPELIRIIDLPVGSEIKILLNEDVVTFLNYETGKVVA